MKDLVLPSFEMDCRDWLVVTPDEVGLPGRGRRQLRCSPCSARS